MKILILLALLVCCPVIHAGSPNLIVNGGFEKPEVPIKGWTTFTPATSFQGWIVKSGAVDITGTRYFASAAGRQSLDLNALELGSVSQTVETRSGQRYLLTFSYAANPIAEQGPKSLDVLWNGRVLATLKVDSTGKTGARPGWVVFSGAVAGTGSDTLSFESKCPGCAGPTIDKVSLTEIAGAGLRTAAR